MSLPGRKVLLLAALAVFAFLLLQCAEMAQPPGGEPDKTGPRLLRSEPASGAVDVPPSNRITLYFSEHVVKPRTQDVVFITPRQSEPVELNWRGDRLEVELAEPFRDNTTYILNVSSGIADLRGNKLDSSMSMAFSTGPTIDSGRIGGIVLDGDQPQTGILVGLYDRTALDTAVPFDSIYPDYLAQTNSSGRFDLNYLPSRDYRLIAFKDINNDERFNPTEEQWAVPARPIDVRADPPMDSLYLVLAPSQDTTTPAIIAATPLAGEMVKIRFSTPINLTQLRQRPSDILISSIEHQGRHYSALGFLEFRWDNSAAVTPYFGALEDTLFRLEVKYDAQQPALVKDSVVLRFGEDDQPPLITAAPFAGKDLFLREVDLYLDFGEPVDSTLLTSETFSLFNNADESIPVTWQMTNPFSVRLVPEVLAEAQSYRLEVVEFEIGDLAGNLLGDSLRSFQFSTYDPEEMGSISGTVSVAVADHESDAVVLTFVKVPEDKRFELPVDGTDFAITIPPGQYLLHGFADADRDGSRDLGNIDPEAYAEPIDWYPDTVAVRARFETAGIDLTIQ